jgi:hypothetical protein
MLFIAVTFVVVNVGILTNDTQFKNIDAIVVTLLVLYVGTTFNNAHPLNILAISVIYDVLVIFGAVTSDKHEVNIPLELVNNVLPVVIVPTVFKLVQLLKNPDNDCACGIYKGGTVLKPEHPLNILLDVVTEDKLKEGTVNKP